MKNCVHMCKSVFNLFHGVFCVCTFGVVDKSVLSGKSFVFEDSELYIISKTGKIMENEIKDHHFICQSFYDLY